MSLSTVLAKALFDNAAESPEELAFRKGDILMVLEQEQGGGPGWWLCSLHGRQGIAPANRLRLLQTAAPAPGTDARDSAYPSSGQQARADASSAEEPPGPAEGVYQSPVAAPAPRPGELRQAEGGRPRSHSSSGARPRPDWDAGVAGRPRSPSLRGRGGEAALYQTPAAPAPLAAARPRMRGAPASEAVYLTPSAVPRPAAGAPEARSEAAYLVPREAAGAGHSEGCYLVPRPAVTAVPGEDLYQRPAGGAAVTGPALDTPAATKTPEGTTVKSGSCSSLNGPTLTPSKTCQEAPGMYQTPTPPGGGMPRTPQNERKLPRGDIGSAGVSPAMALGQHHKQITPTAKGSPRSLLKAVPKDPGGSGIPSSPVARGKLAQSAVRGSPLLARAGKAGVPGSPNFGRKPPPPAPPVRGVTRKDTSQSAPTPAPKPVLQVVPAPPPQTREEEERQRGVAQNGEERGKDGRMPEDEMKKDLEILAKVKKGEDREYEDPDDEELNDQVYDTPPTNRWQHPARPASCEEDESVYNTPRALPLHVDQGSEIYDVPTLALNAASDPQQQTYSVPACLAVAGEAEEDVYSVPSLPGLPLAAGEIPGLAEDGGGSVQVYLIPSPGKAEPAQDEASEPDGGIYDMPALTLDVPARRLSVSSTGSGDAQWRAPLSALIQSALGSASPRDLAASLAEILAAWRAAGLAAGDAPPPLQQAWARLSELQAALAAAPSEALLAQARRALEDSGALLPSQGRPRLPSQDSLSRRPLPALPVAEVKPVGGGMGSRKGSWIQERPLPPPPPPAFPLPATPAPLPPSGGRSEEEEGEPGNEYAGIGLTPAPPIYPVGDVVGYVKLQGKPVPVPDAQVEKSSSQVISTAETRLSPSPPLPVSLSLEDSELLSFYSSQSLAHLSCLADAIDALFTSVQGNQPPRVFVSRGKSLIVTAHKLVFIGDTLSRLLSSSDIRAKVTTSGGRLCQALKVVVVATKGAAQNYPSVPATQEMVDRVAELSQHAAGFSGLLQRLAEIS